MAWVAVTSPVVTVTSVEAKVAAADLADRVTLIEVAPGPLPLADQSFDLVFCKDVVCHLAHKAPFFAEAFRVLRPGGQFLCTDFIDGEDDEGAVHLQGYVTKIAEYGLSFRFEPRAVYGDGLAAARFAPIDFRDNSATTTAATRRETGYLASPESAGLAAALGEAMFAVRIEASGVRLEALESGGLKHGHFRARRPG